MTQNALKRLAVESPATRYEPMEFSLPGPLRDLIVGFIVNGQKTESSVVAAFFDRNYRPYPQAGDRFTVVDSEGHPVIDIEYEKVELVKFGDVTEEHAIAATGTEAGRPDDVLRQWQRIHKAFWESIGRREGLGADFSVTPETLLICSKFKVLQGRYGHLSAS